MSDDRLEIRYVPLSTVALWERNPKLHHLGDLAASIERYGFKESPRYEPTLNGGQGGIVAGNGRIETLDALWRQNKPAPRGILVQDDQWLVPVTFGVDAESQEAAEAYGIDANNLTMLGGDFTAFDLARMWSSDYTDILASLATADALPITVDGDALDGLLAAMILPVEPGDGGDDFDTTPAEGPTRAQSGDLWYIGPHRLLVGDCTDPANVARLMGGEKADMVWIDPPYGVDYEGGRNPESNTPREKLAGDTTGALYGLCMALTAPHCKSSAPWYIWFADRAGEPVYAAVSQNGYTVRAMIVWNKTDAHYGNFMAQYMQKHEPCLYCVKDSPPWYGPTNEVTVWDVKQPNSNPDHPTQKPLELADRCLRNSSARGAIVCDWFAGSGTLLIAAHRLGRVARLCEISPRYADVILRRAEAEGLPCERAE